MTDPIGRLTPCAKHGVVNCLTCHKFQVRNLPREHIEAIIERDRARGGTVYVKWTCEHCGVRRPHKEPFTFPKQYICTACGKESHPKGFGVLTAYERPGQ